MTSESTLRRSRVAPLARAGLRLAELEARLTPTGLDLLAPLTPGGYAVGPDAGDPGVVIAYRPDGTEAIRGEPYGSGFTSGIRVALGDIDGDGAPDLITAPGPGGAPDVRVYSGRTGELLGQFLAYEEGFRGGVYVGAADLTGDGKAEVVVSPDRGGGPRVRVLDGASIVGGGGVAAVADFLAIDDPNFRGGARVALGDVTGDGVADLVVGAGFEGGPRVAGYDGAALGRGERVRAFDDFFAYEESLRNGVYVGVGDVNGDGVGDLIFGGGPGGGPRVRVIDLQAVLAGGGFGKLDELPGANLANFFAGDVSSREGVRVGVAPSGGGAAIVAADVATHSVRVFGLDGTPGPSLGAPAGSRGVFYAAQAFDRAAPPPGPLPPVLPPDLGTVGSVGGNTGQGGGSTGTNNPTTGGNNQNTGGASTGTGNTTPASSGTVSPGLYQGVSTSYSSPLEQMNQTFTGASWLFNGDGTFSVFSARNEFITIGFWGNRGGVTQFSTYNTNMTASNKYNIAGTARASANGRVAVEATFESQASLFSLFGNTFGTLTSTLVPVG